MKTIFTITAIQDEHLFKNKCSRTFGFLFDKEEAIELVEKNAGDIHECRYKYVVIEEFGPGIHAFGGDSIWFKWNGDKFVECEKPDNYLNVYNYGMG